MSIATLGTLLGQALSLHAKASLRLFLIFGPWTLATVVITNGYAGLLYSLLDRPNSPFIPETVQEIMEMGQSSGIKFEFATFSHFKTDSKGAGTSSLKGDVEIYRQKLRVPCPFCDKLDQKVHFMIQARYNTEAIARSIHSIIRISPLTTDLVNDTIFSKNVVLIESAVALRNVIGGLKFDRTNRKEIARRGRVEPFTSTLVWATERRYFSRLFLPFLGLLTSSGLLQEWEASFDMLSNAYVRIQYENIQNLSGASTTRIFTPFIHPNSLPDHEPPKKTKNGDFRTYVRNSDGRRVPFTPSLYLRMDLIRLDQLY
jgi:hypothetical protein